VTIEKQMSMVQLLLTTTANGKVETQVLKGQMLRFRRKLMLEIIE
jgi:hypothetical protein